VLPQALASTASSRGTTAGSAIFARATFARDTFARATFAGGAFARAAFALAAEASWPARYTRFWLASAGHPIPEFSKFDIQF
jgi:hypothetical protein